MQRDGGPGGGAGGLGSGGSFTGASESLEIVGDHAYGISGKVPCDNNYTALLSFTSGNFYLVGSVQFHYADDTAPTDNAAYKIEFNDGVVVEMVITEADHATGVTLIPVIIPPYTKVLLAAKNSATSEAHNQIGNITGRIYRG